METLVFRSPDSPLETQIEINEDGTASITAMGAFRVGEFTDSMGRTNKWSLKDIEAIASNFQKLSENGQFPNVPLREDHSYSVRSVVGYMTKLYVHGDHLLVDAKITEPDAVGKYERGTYRARSAEIVSEGFMNSKTPVLTGLAFVDIPSVDKLFSLSRDVDSSNDDNNSSGEPVTITEEDLKAEFKKGFGAGSEDAIKGIKPEPPYKFSVDGSDVSKYEDVQNHIDSLEKFQTEARESTRKNFVSSLVERNIIPAPQKDDMIALATGMDDEQFEKFRSVHDAMSSNSLFEKHGDGGSESTDNDDPESEIKDLEDIISMHRMGGLDEDEIEKTESFKKLQKLQKDA